jgi:hypothetical protein
MLKEQRTLREFRRESSIRAQCRQPQQAPQGGEEDASGIYVPGLRQDVQFGEGAARARQDLYVRSTAKAVGASGGVRSRSSSGVAGSGRRFNRGGSPIASTLCP